ncbi:MAG: nucleotide exchange factor GrpE [Patescibacteria group bacterium]
MTNTDDTIQYDDSETKRMKEDIDEGDEESVDGKVRKLKADLKQAQELQKEYLDGWQRAKADYLNYKKDEGKRFREIAENAPRSIIEECIMVLDSFDLALKYEIQKEVRQGIIMIQSQLKDVFQKYGFEEMKTAGEKFNTEFHESLGEEESDMESGTVIEEVQKGYSLNGRVIRPARVKIAK